VVPTKKTHFVSFFRAKLIIMNRLNTVFFIIAASVLSVTHSIALQLSLYWHFWWFDLPMHFLGGAVLALGVFSAYEFSAPLPKRWQRLLPVMSAVLIIALVWEYYEVLIGIPIESDHEVDTLTDIFLGLVGGAVGYSVGRSLANIQK
jgi:hypothetical protein